jgi:iron complex transport system substrate-binding protein
MSVITAGDSGEFYRADTGQALGTVMSDLALLRPAPQQGEDDTFSVETLPQHDADVVLVINFGGEDQDPNFTAFVNSPLFTSLAAARAGQVYIIDGTRTVGAGWSKMGAFLSELERILLAPDLAVDVVVE